jgi:molybdopterin-containing oxidoreductase family membrane subunit
MYVPSLIDGALLGGSILFFLFLFGLMLRFVPFMPIAEQKEILEELTHQARKRRGQLEEGSAAHASR